MKNELLDILGKYKVIGDTTYGLGFKEANELTDEIMNKIILIITTHKQGDGRYCDTGADMEWDCRSECVRLAVERLIP